MGNDRWSAGSSRGMRVNIDLMSEVNLVGNIDPMLGVS